MPDSLTDYRVFPFTALYSTASLHSTGYLPFTPLIFIFTQYRVCFSFFSVGFYTVYRIFSYCSICSLLLHLCILQGILFYLLTFTLYRIFPCTHCTITFTTRQLLNNTPLTSTTATHSTGYFLLLLLLFSSSRTIGYSALLCSPIRCYLTYLTSQLYSTTLTLLYLKLYRVFHLTLLAQDLNLYRVFSLLYSPLCIPLTSTFTPYRVFPFTLLLYLYLYIILSLNSTGYSLNFTLTSLYSTLPFTLLSHLLQRIPLTPHSPTPSANFLCLHTVQGIRLHSSAAPSTGYMPLLQQAQELFTEL